MSPVIHSYCLFFFFFYKCSPLVSICLAILCLPFKITTSVNQSSEKALAPNATKVPIYFEE